MINNKIPSSMQILFKENNQILGQPQETYQK